MSLFCPRSPHGTQLSCRCRTLFLVTVSRAFLVCADLGHFGNWSGILWNVPLIGVCVVCASSSDRVVGFGGGPQGETPSHPITSGLVLHTGLVPVTVALVTWLGCASGRSCTVPLFSPLRTVLFGRKPLSTAHSQHMGS